MLSVFSKWAAVAFLPLLFLTACSEPSKPKPTFLSTDISGVNFGKDFRLSDHEGNKRTLSDFKGKVVVFFLVTPLPGMPAPMGNWRNAMEKTGHAADRVQVFFTVVQIVITRQAQHIFSIKQKLLGLSVMRRAIKEVVKEFSRAQSSGRIPGHHNVDPPPELYLRAAGKCGSMDQR